MAQVRAEQAVPAPAVNPDDGEQPSSSELTVGDLVTAYLRVQRQVILEANTELTDALTVHDLRVAIRRTRSTLRSFRSIFDAEAAATLDTQLRHYAQLLGAVRDTDVMRDRLATQLAELPEHLVIGPVGEQIEHTLAAERERYRIVATRAMNTAWYLALLDSLYEWSTRPPLTAAAAQPANLARATVTRTSATLRKRLRQIGGGQADPMAVHRARKAAKRARYAAELAATAQPAAPTRRTIKRAKVVQEVLGEYQDSIVAAATLRRIAPRATGPSGFTYGVLYADQQRRREDALRAVLLASRHA